MYLWLRLPKMNFIILSSYEVKLLTLNLPVSSAYNLRKTVWDQIMAQQNAGPGFVRPGLDPNCSTLWWYYWNNFKKKLLLKKIIRNTQHAKSYFKASRIRKDGCTFITNILGHWKPLNSKVNSVDQDQTSLSKAVWSGALTFFFIWVGVLHANLY